MGGLNPAYKELYLSHLDYFKEEISLYKSEDNLWKLAGDIKNTPGNLCIHICGNLKHFYGSVLGNTDYVRNRDLEFSKKNVSRTELLADIESAKEIVTKVFDSLNDSDFNKIYPLNAFGENVTIGFVISRLIAHLAYHLGQINYHRRILEF